MATDLYTTLGYENNLLINEYREKQFIKLKAIFEKNLSSVPSLDTLSLAEQKKFLFHPDHASILLSQNFIDQPEIHIAKLKHEYFLFIERKYTSMVAYSGKKIEGTDIYLSIIDNNPLNSMDAHPDKGGGVGWGDKTADEWKDLYDSTFDLLKQIDLGFYSELNQMLQKIVPFGTAEHIHYSASYKECVGTLYMGYTLGTDIPELHVLEGMVHESSHNKLNLIMQCEEITLNDMTEKYYSPYRPDARHMHGVFLGIHALTPTVYILLKGIEKGLVTHKNWVDKACLYHMKNKIGIATMKKHGILSRMGQRVFQDIINVAQVSDPIVKKIVTEYNLPIQDIQKRAKEHFMEVNKNYPHLEY